MKTRKRSVFQTIFLFAILSVILLLSGCGTGEKLTATSTNETANYKGTLSIGDMIYEGFFNYYYDGIVENSVVVTVDTRNLFIPIETNEWVTLPKTEGKIKIKIKDVNKEKGTVHFELVENK
jgi:uncharacterized protein YceK